MKKTILTTTFVGVLVAGMVALAFAQPGTVSSVSGDLVTVQLSGGAADFAPGAKIKLNKKSGKVTEVNGDAVTMEISRGKASTFSAGEAVDLKKKGAAAGDVLLGC